MKMKFCSMRMGRSRLAIAVSLAAILSMLAGCSEKRPEGDVLATVGDHKITTEDFEREVNWRVKTQRPLPDKQALLDEMIWRELSIQKAQKTGLENEFEVKRIHDEIVASTLKDRELTPVLESLTVSETEIRSVYETDIAKYTRPGKMRLAIIQIKTDRKMSTEKVADLESRIAEAQKMVAALPSGTSGFGKVAVEFSEDQASRYKGGDVGWYDDGLEEYRWPKEVITAGFALKQNGAVSDVIKTSEGLYIVMRLDSREQTVTPLEQVQASIKRRLLTEKKQNAEATFTREMRAFAPVQTRTQVLANVQYPTTTIVKAGETVPPALARPQ